jgi:hypothetical protein
MLSANQKPPYENGDAATLLFVTLLRIYMSTTKTEPKQKGTVILTCPRIMQLHVCIASVRSAARKMHAKCHKATKSKKTNKNIRKQKKQLFLISFITFISFQVWFFFQFPKITLKNL